MGSSPQLGIAQSLLRMSTAPAAWTAAKWLRAAAAAGTGTKRSGTRQRRASVSAHLDVGGYTGKHRRLT
jgi:hypothetical protein